MSATSRATLYNKLFRVLKKQYQPVKPPADRSVLEHLLYACCLENSSFEQADEAFARLQQDYFDWNEVRVTTINELAEVMNCVSEPMEAATRLKKVLHSMFESHYAFDIDMLRKENLGKAMQQLQKYKGITPFVVSYVAQSALAGHSIGIDRAMVQLLTVIGAITPAEGEKFTAPGLERAIPKNKGVEFASLAHQLAAAFLASPFNNDLRKVLLTIAPDCKERFPKRGGRKPKAAPAETKKAADKKKKAKSKAAASTKSAKPTKSAKKKVVTKKKVAKSASAKKKVAKKPVKKKKKSPTKRLARKKPR